MFKHYLNGTLVAGKGPAAAVVNPATEQAVERFKWADAGQAAAALKAAEKAFTT